MIDELIKLWLELIGLCLGALLGLSFVYILWQLIKTAKKEELASKDTEEMLEAKQSSKYLRMETDRELISGRQPQLDDKENQVS